VTSERERAGELQSAASFLDTKHWERALAAARAKPSGIFVDIDGTLSPIVPAPEEANVLPICRRALAELAALLDLVVILSGRQIDDARRMVGLDDLVYFGNHGLERWDKTRGYESWAEQYVSTMATTFASIEQRLAGLPGIRFENKKTVISVHYRLAPDPAAARTEVLKAAEELAGLEGLRLAEGKRVVELRPPVDADKGRTLERVVREHSLRGVLCLGDDRTDVGAFRALRALRERGEVEGLAIGVGGEETPAELLAVADALLPGPYEVGVFLQRLAATLAGDGKKSGAKG
jgi:trehalose 6-phosphate phosphatase